MPTFKIIVSPDRLFVHAPVSGGKHLAFDPLSPDVLDETSQLLRLGLGLAAHEHWKDLPVRKEWQGHYLSDIAVYRIVTRVSRLKAKLLYLKATEVEIRKGSKKFKP